jgi:hypothetical protein
MFSTIKYIVLFLFLLGSWSNYGQQKDKSLQQSNDLIYEGNELLENDFVSAEKEYRKAISKKEDNSPGSFNLGNAYYNSNLYDEALARHFEAAKHASSRTEKHKAFHNMGNTLMQMKQCKKAVEAFKNALRNDSTDDETRYNLALAKDCADQQGEGDSGEQDQKEDNKQENQENQDQQDKEQDEGDENEDQQDRNDENENEKEGDDQEDKDGKPKDDQGDKENDPRDQKKQRQQQPGKLSPQQVKSLLEAMNNEEKKVQEKINAKKAKGAKVKREKDW